MRTYRQCLQGVLLLIFVLIFVCTGCNTSSQNPTGSESVSDKEAHSCQLSEETVLGYTNYERCLQGLNALLGDEQLDAAAKCHADDMSHREYFEHVAPGPAPYPCGGAEFSERISHFGYSGLPGGENLARGRLSARTVVRGWMNSPTHRANILRPEFMFMGVGYNGLMWVQEFGY